jgi:hypothetical protein
MQYSTKRRVVLGMTTGGLLISGFGMATAQAATGASADGSASNSPGLLAGNLIEIPVNLPVNACGDTVNVIGILDSVTGNSCHNGGAAGSGGAGASADGVAKNSPGAGSGNLIEIPINAPVNVCGDSLSVVGIANPATGNACANEAGSHGSGEGAGASAGGVAKNSPGIGSGNLISIPINAPVNVCGDSVSVVGIANPTTGNACANEGPVPVSVPTPPPGHPHPGPPSTGCGCAVQTPHEAAAADVHPASITREAPLGNLAETGSGAMFLAPTGAGMLGGGFALRRKLPIRGR